MTTADKSPESDTSGPLRDPQFRWFFSGRFVSMLGSAMAPVALAFAVLGSSHSAGDLGVVLAARSVPMLVFLVVGGVIADRGSRRTVLIIANLGAALTQGGVAAILLAGSSFNLVAIAALQFFNGTFTAFASPALRGIVPQLVDVDRRQRANSLLGTVRTAATVLGPSIAGVVVVAVGGGWAIVADAVSYLISAFCMSRLNLPQPMARRQSNFFHELREGWTGFRSLRWVCITVIAFAVTNGIFVGVWNVLGPTLAAASIGAASWGVVLSVRAVGVLAASAAMYRLTLIRSLAAGLCCYALGALPMIVLGLWQTLYLLLPVALLAGLGQGVAAIIWETSLQNRVAPTMLSRIAAYDDLFSYIAVPVGQISVASIMAAAGGTRVMVIGGILFGVVAIVPVLFRSVRQPANATESQPEPKPEAGAVSVA